MNQSRLLALALVGVAVLAAAWFLGNYDLIREREWQSPEVRVWRERFLAAERLLAKLEIETERIGALESAERFGAETLLVVPDERGSLSPRALAAVRGFVERGGHLLAESEEPGHDDPLLDAFAITRHDPETGWSNSWGGPWMWGKPLTEPNERTDRALVELRFADDAPALLVRIGPAVALGAEQPRFVLGDAEQARLLQLDRGAGRVTAVADLGFATNIQIGRDDNAELFVALVRQLPTVERVAFYRGERESLGAWLRKHASLVLAALGAFIAIALWRAFPRLGPLLPDPQPQRRRLLDHLRASGRLLWGAGRKGALAQAAAHGAMAAVVRHFPHVSLMNDAERAGFLCTRFAIAPAIAADIVAATLTTRSAPALLALVRACAQIHAQLAPGAAVSHAPLTSKSSQGTTP